MTFGVGIGALSGVGTGVSLGVTLSRVGVSACSVFLGFLRKKKKVKIYIYYTEIHGGGTEVHRGI